MRLVPLIIAVGVVAVGGTIGYTKFAASQKENQQAKTQTAVPVEAVHVKSAPLVSALNTVGTLKANESLILKPEITGRIESIPFAEGAFAKKGELLVQIDDRVFAAELKQAEAQLNLARMNFNRAKLLKEKGAGTVINYDTTSANLNVTQAQVDLARATLDKTKIVAPFDGVMGLRKISPGDYVNPGQEIATFQSKNPIKAEFTLPETATRVVAAGQNIDVKIDAFPERTFTGRVYAIDPQIDEASRNITLRALIPNDDGQLQPGLFARVSIITAQKDQAFFLPESAIIPRGNDNFVMRIGADKKVTTIPVTLGERKNGEVEILSGVNAEEIIVVAGQQKLKDDQEANYTIIDNTTAQEIAPAAGNGAAR